MAAGDAKAATKDSYMPQSLARIISPAQILLWAGILTLAELICVTALAVSGHETAIPTVIGIGLPLQGLLATALVAKGNVESNVANTAAVTAAKEAKDLVVGANAVVVEAINGRHETVRELTAVVEKVTEGQTTELKDAIRKNGHT